MKRNTLLGNDSAMARSVKFPTKDPRYTVYSHDPNDYILSRIAETGVFYEIDLLRICAALPLKEGVVIDCGANVGNHTLFFTTQMRRAVVAYEPSPTIFEALMRTVEANGLSKRVTPKNVGLSDRRGKAKLCLVLDNPGKSHIVEGYGEKGSEKTDYVLEEVKLETIDANHSSARNPVALIKIDVEGFEGKVLDGAKKTIRRYGPIIVAEAHKLADMSSLNTFMAELDYELLAMAGQSRNLFFCPKAESDMMRRAADEQRRFDEVNARKASLSGAALTKNEDGREIDRLRRHALVTSDRAFKAESAANQAQAELSALGKRANIPLRESRARDIANYKRLIGEHDVTFLLMEEEIRSLKTALNEVNLKYRAVTKSLSDLKAEQDSGAKTSKTKT